jgi:hypothetical protein
MNQIADIDLDRPLVPQLLKLGPANRPGAGFEYQDVGHTCSRPSSRTTRTRARRTTPDRCLFEPLDITTRPTYEGPLIDISKANMEAIKVFGWLRDYDGAPLRILRPYADRARPGEARRALPPNGVYNGRRILDESFVRAATQAQSGDLPGMEYGFLWWITPLATESAYSAIGLHGQLVVVVQPASW